MQGAQHDRAIDLAIGDRPALVRAHSRHRIYRTGSQTENGNLLAADAEGAALPHRDLFDRTEPMAGADGCLLYTSDAADD
mgnify:CR=1 FL=1